MKKIEFSYKELMRMGFKYSRNEQNGRVEYVKQDKLGTFKVENKTKMLLMEGVEGDALKVLSFCEDAKLSKSSPINPTLVFRYRIVNGEIVEPMMGGRNYQITLENSANLQRFVSNLFKEHKFLLLESELDMMYTKFDTGEHIVTFCSTMYDVFIEFYKENKYEDEILIHYGEPYQVGFQVLLVFGSSHDTVLKFKEKHL